VVGATDPNTHVEYLNQEQVKQKSNSALVCANENRNEEDGECEDKVYANIGKLVVGKSETSAVFMVSATSTVDSSKTASSIVNVGGKGTASVEITPSPAFVSVGNTAQFSAALSGKTADEAKFTWSVTGAEDKSTTIGDDGVLFVGHAESSSTLIITVRLDSDTSVFGYAVVLVQDRPTTTINIKPKGDILPQPGSTKQFTAQVKVPTFEDDGVVWEIAGQSGSQKTNISESGLLTIGDDELSSLILVSAYLKYDNTKVDTVFVQIDSGMKSSVRINEKHQVISMPAQTTESIPECPNCIKIPFTATTTLNNSANHTLVWGVNGGNGNTGFYPSEVSGEDMAYLWIDPLETASTLVVKVQGQDATLGGGWHCNR
jgi:hypothetical protein